MIRNEIELKGTQERISYFQSLLGQMRLKARPEEFRAMASGYRAEIEKMQGEVLDYLTRHASETIQAESA